RFRSDLLPATVLVERYFSPQRAAVAQLEAGLVALGAELEERREADGTEDGPLADVIEGEGEKRKITAKSIKSRLREIGDDRSYAEERDALVSYGELLDRESSLKSKLKGALERLDADIAAKHETLSEIEVRQLAVDEKWLGSLD